MAMESASASPWVADGAPGWRLESVNLVEGTTFAVSGRSGTIGEAATHGLFVLDTRVLSRWQLVIHDRTIESLAHIVSDPFCASFVARSDAGDTDPPIVIVHRRYVGGGMRDDVEIRNHGPSIDLRVTLHLAADLAGLFAVKAGRITLPVSIDTVPEGAGFAFRRAGGAGVVDAVIVTPTPAPSDRDPGAGTLSWDARIDAGATWSMCVQVCVEATGRMIEPAYRCGEPAEVAIRARRQRAWREYAPQVSAGDADFERVIENAIDELDALRIYDPEHPDRVVVAAGAPWFMALFGRDSLLSSWMALPFGLDLAAGVLSELADNQGTAVRPRTEEQPGRILHEVRFDPLSHDLLGGANTYYGTVDATPLFVMLAAELHRWTGLTDRIRDLMPAVDRAIEWIERFGDRDGDGFVEYLRADESGLEHQGWKDSWDGIRHADGSVARPPIALCEVQGYVYAAYRGRAELARSMGDTDGATEFDRRADALQLRFDDSFWLDDRGWYAVGLDADKQPIRSLTSNVGHLLWTGIVPERRAARLVEHLTSPTMCSGWGLRTLAADAAGFNPLSYHCGSVWPHDTALTVAGLSRYGFNVEADRLASDLIDAATAVGGSLPELFGGFARDDIGEPVPYPSSCSPQAWASAAPMLLMRAMLGLEPDVPNGRIRMRPRLPERIGVLTLRGLQIGPDLVDITVSGRDCRVTGTDLSVEVT